MTDKTKWQASLIEQRIAWGTTFCAIIIAMLAVAQPQWFKFSFATIKPFHNQAPVAKSAQVMGRKTIAVKTQVEQPAPVKTTPVKAVTIKPVTRSTPVTQVNAKPANNKVITAVKKAAFVTPGFYVQLGAFEKTSRAHGFADQLKRKGWSVKITDKKNGLHAVWIGPRSTKAGAEKLLKTIRSTLKQKGFIIQHNNG